MGPRFKASEGKGTVAGSRAPRAGVQARLGKQGQEAAMPATDMGEKELSHFKLKSVEWRPRYVETCRYKTWGSFWII